MKKLLLVICVFALFNLTSCFDDYERIEDTNTNKNDIIEKDSNSKESNTAVDSKESNTADDSKESNTADDSKESNTADDSKESNTAIESKETKTAIDSKEEDKNEANSELDNDEVIIDKWPIEITDAMGRTVTFDSSISKIVLLTDLLVDTVYIDDELVVAKVKELDDDSVIGTIENVDLFEVIFLEPDLVICQFELQNIFVSELEKSGIKAIAVSKDSKEVLDAIDNLINN